MHLRRNFSSSGLVRLLSGMALVDVDAPRQDVAERVSLWVDAFDAVTLHEAHQVLKIPADERPIGGRATAAETVEAEFLRVRATLTKSIATNEVARVNGAQANSSLLLNVALPEADPTPDQEAAADYSPYRQRYLDQQRHMEAKIGPLRTHVRQALSKASPPLRQLATLDAVWEQTLSAREQKLLAAVPVLLGRRFDHLRQAHLERLEAAQQQDDPTLWRQSGGWLDVFGKELHEVLLAELNVRLQPVMGLIEAFSNEVKK